MQDLSRRRVLQAGLLTAVSAGLLSRTTAAQAGTIEAHFAVPGPWAVATGTSGGHRLYHPADLGAGGLRHPIVTWGNGTAATPDNYPGLLNRLASWGFAVVASTDTTTGTGTEMLAALQHLVGLDADPSSPFHGKLDVTKVAAVGHSQGAGGSVNAANLSGGLVTTVVPIALPAPIWVSPGDAFSVAALPCPVFFMSGTSDWIISPSSAVTGYYNQAAHGAAKAMLKGAGHNDIQNTGGGFLGYLTAWLMYQLRGDALARGAFVGSPPQLLADTAWQDQATKGLA
ncbi:alpha/beta hydrolase [Nonomuraea sp. NPDC050556]|uniref:poly(ethylene terephthalate) hydrolase family protein n=1 Tax=Nonomuraea sp. NPDC050556 TaxID=3364369 RepID=UPI0037AB85A0